MRCKMKNVLVPQNEEELKGLEGKLVSVYRYRYGSPFIYFMIYAGINKINLDDHHEFINFIYYIDKTNKRKLRKLIESYSVKVNEIRFDEHTGIIMPGDNVKYYEESNEKYTQLKKMIETYF